MTWLGICPCSPERAQICLIELIKFLDLKKLEEIASLNLADLMAQWMYENCHILFGDTGTLVTYLPNP